MKQPVEQFNRASVKNLRAEMQKDLNQLAKKWGIDIHCGNASFNSTSINIKVQASIIQDGQVLTPEANAFNIYAPLNGLSGYKLGDKVIINGTTYTLSGWNRKAPKYPVQISNGGKNYKATVNHVLSGTKRS